MLVRLLQLAMRWKWLIVGSVAAFMLLGLALTLLMTPKYTASSTLEIQRESYRIVQVQGVEPESSPVDLEFYQTQYGLLTSQSLAQRVARNLGLHQNRQFFEMFGSSKYVEQLKAGPGTAAQQAERLREAGEILLENLAVHPVRLSRLVSISFTSPDAEFSARVINSWGKNFIEATLERRFEATSYARRFLEQRLGQLRQRLEESERLLVSYAAAQNIVNIPLSNSNEQERGSSSTERPLVAENLGSINRELNDAIAARVLAESRLRSSGGSTQEALQNQAITGLRQKRAELSAQYSSMLTQFRPEYPPAMALSTQIAQLDKAIAREEQRVTTNLRQTYEAAAARENVLRRQVEQLRIGLLDQRGRAIQYNIYQREVDTNRQLYDGLLQRYKEIGVAGGVGVNNVVVIDAADAPQFPSSPKILLNLAVSLLLGGFVGVGLAFALDQIDEAISLPTDVTRALDLPLLGTIPKVEDGTLEAEFNDRKSPIVEAYLSTQTSLSFTTDHGFPRSLVVTSTRPAEGKSTTSMGLARSLARTGRRVVLVDADMRAPSLHYIFDVKNERGLSNYLSGETNLDALIVPEALDSVSLMPAGPPPPNAAELLTGDRIGQLITHLMERFDNIVLDVPPVMGLADAPLIGTRAEGVVFVLESHATRRTMARIAIGRLRSANVRILGAILTKFESKRAQYGYGYEYGYGYGEQRRRKD